MLIGCYIGTHASPIRLPVLAERPPSSSLSISELFTLVTYSVPHELEAHCRLRKSVHWGRPRFRVRSFPTTSSTKNMLFRLLLLLAAVAPYTFADVEFTAPAAGATETGGSTLDVEWKESGTGPPISSFSTYQLFLCAGGNDAGSFVSTQNACTQIRLRLMVPLLTFQS